MRKAILAILVLVALFGIYLLMQIGADVKPPKSNYDPNNYLQSLSLFGKEEDIQYKLKIIPRPINNDEIEVWYYAINIGTMDNDTIPVENIYGYLQFIKGEDTTNVACIGRSQNRLISENKRAISLFLDYSGSMFIDIDYNRKQYSKNINTDEIDKKKIPKIKNPQLLIDYVLNSTNTLIANKNKVDLFKIIKFGTNIERITDFNQNIQYLQNKLNESKEDMGGTSIFQALYDLKDDFSQLDDSYIKAAVVFSDGFENESVVSVNDLITTYQELGIPIFSVGYTYDATPSELLQELSLATMGDYLNAPSPDNISQLYNLIDGYTKKSNYVKFKWDLWSMPNEYDKVNLIVFIYNKTTEGVKVNSKAIYENYKIN